MVNKKTIKKNKFPYQILIVDVLIFALIAVLITFLNLHAFSRTYHWGEMSILGLAAPCLIFLIVGFIFYLYIEYKYNHLNKKNIFLILGIVIALANLIAVSILPSEISLPNNMSMIITPLERVYYILTGFAFAMLPYCFFYLLPRKILNRRYMKILLYIIVGFTGLLILLSFITDRETYAHLFSTHFEDFYNYGICSILYQKNIFGRFLLAGIIATILLHIQSKNWKWLLLLIPFFVFLILTMSKMAIIAAVLIMFIYLIVRLVFLARHSKDNLIIISLISGFIILMASLFIVFIVNSQNGILFSIKSAFIKISESASNTFNSRLLIWECAFKLLAPYQYIIGFGIIPFGRAVNLTYTPVAPEWEYLPNIYTAHNAGIELIGNGGIILLGIYLFLHIYLIYAAVKIYKHNKLLSIIEIASIILYILYGITDSNFICDRTESVVMTGVLVLPIMCEYYLYEHKEEKEIREDIINDAKKIKKVKFSSKLSNLNKKRIILEAKYIAYDLNKNIKL